jgi:hypothetical protein
MTFFSKAARILIQGSSTVAGEVANAIEANPCSRRRETPGPVHPRHFGNSSLAGAKPSLFARPPCTDCLLAAGLPLKNSLRLWVNPFRGTLETFLERSR